MKMDSILKILKKPWATEMLSLYGEDKNKVLKWSDFKDKIFWNDKLLGERLKKLCKIGILVKEKGGYRYYSRYPLEYIFKSEDIKLIQECPIDSVPSLYFPYKKKGGIFLEVRVASYYCLKKRNPDLDNIIKPTLSKLCQYIDLEYFKKLKIIIDEECKKIKNKHFVKFIREWQNIIYKNMSLLPMRISRENFPEEIKCDIPEKYKVEFRSITEKIWERLSQESQPFGIMFRF